MGNQPMPKGQFSSLQMTHLAYGTADARKKSHQNQLLSSTETLHMCQCPPALITQQWSRPEADSSIKNIGEKCLETGLKNKDFIVKKPKPTEYFACI